MSGQPATARRSITKGTTKTSRMRIVLRISWLGAPLLLLVLATVAAFYEAAPFLARKERPEQYVAAEISTDTESAWVSIFESRYARTARLDGCLQTLHRMLGSAESSIGMITALTRGCL